MHKYLVVIGGPTASGKTKFAIEIAKYFHTEIISADSRQFYREMEIGTAKPDENEQTEVPHHLIDNLSIFDEYNVGKYEKEVLGILNQLYKKHNIVVLVGGTGMYIDAVCEGIDDMPAIDMAIRNQLNQQFQDDGIVPLQLALKNEDPDYYKIVDINNHVRLIRALEVIYSTGRPYSMYRKNTPVDRDFKIIRYALDLERENLYSRIDTRMDLMLSLGLMEEAKKLYPLRHLNALHTVGYTEIFDFFDNKYDEEEMLRLLKRNSRRYAKRQITWFNKGNKYKWIKPSDLKQVIKEIEVTINSQVSK